MKIRLLLLSLLYLSFNIPGFAQPSADVKGEAGLLFAYYPKDGMQQQFNEGYKKHLQWHRDQNDPLPWYGWYVMSGERVGMFVDGTFGISFEAFDNRPAPIEDRVHFQKNVAPYGNTTWRKIFKLKSSLSTTNRLEDWTPSPFVEVYMISIVPGKESLFEKTVQQVVTALNDGDSNDQFTIYRKLTGGDLPAYLMMVPHKGFAHFDSDNAVTSLSHLIERSFSADTAKDLLDHLSQTVKEIDGETWLYRKDLSYFPKRSE